MKTTRRISIPRELQIGDPIFKVVAIPLDENAKETLSLSKIEIFDVEPTIVRSLEIDETKTSQILVNRKVSLKADGELLDMNGVILNEEDARNAVLTMYEKEIKRVDDLIKSATQTKKDLLKAQDIFKDKPLNKEPIDVNLRVPAGKNAKVVISEESND